MTNAELADKLRGVVVDVCDDHARVRPNLGFTDKAMLGEQLAGTVERLVSSIVALS